MNFSEITVTFFSVIILLPTVASLTRFDQWWIRGFDFPRIQISCLTILMVLFNLYFYSFKETLHYLVLVLLVLSFFYQAYKIYPYTYLAKKQVVSFRGNDPDSIISVLVSNVLMSNTNYEKLLNLIHDKEPDLVLTLETNKTWEEKLSVLEKEYPYTVKIPQDNLYGMHLYSRFELLDIKVKYLIKDDIPSIHGYVKMNNRKKIKIHCLHPKPPSPTEDLTSTNRDAELLMVGKNIDRKKESILVFGDLNDVAWSRTTRLFQKLSGLLDPRIGRGFFNTFHVGYRLLRWPLDHVFHTKDFTLIELARLRDIGSDHFPIFIKLNYEPRAEILQDEPEDANGEEKEWAEEKIKDGNPKDTNI